jgi:hypothetical protein
MEYLVRIVEDFAHILNIGWVLTLALHPHTLVLNITVIKLNHHIVKGINYIERIFWVSRIIRTRIATE